MSRIERISVEPLALAPDPDAPFAQSDALRRLQHEMELYVRGKINGSSFLVAGHRGSGKSWLVMKAIENLRMQSKGLEVLRRFPRPIPVLLHGPDLLEDCEPSVVEEADGKEKRSRHFSQVALKQIALALHRALCDEAAKCFAAWATSQSEVEMAAELQLELDRSPEPVRLLQFWKKLGRDPLGVFNMVEGVPPTHAASTRVVVDVPWAGAEEPRFKRNQMYPELVALATAIHVQREVRRELSTSPEDSREPGTAEKKDKSLWDVFGQLMIQGGHLANPLLGLVFGVIIFVVIRQAGVGVPLTATVAFISSVAATILLNFASARAQKSSFIPDQTKASLDRMLPLLVHRIREAGLHPVFVVDELDKVEQLERKMKDFMLALKFFVTDQAFFCFLADRAYFDSLMDARRTNSDPHEERFFTETVFVHYRLKDLHDYLCALLGEKPRGPGNKPLLRRLLLFRARLHLGDLERYLSLNTEADGNLNISEDEIQRNPANYRDSIIMQLIIEYLMETRDLRQRLRQDPDFVQSVYDGLYYPARQWEIGKTQLNLSQDDFRTYMNQRRKGAEAGEPKRPSDVNFLHARALELVSYLENPSKLEPAACDYVNGVGSVLGLGCDATNMEAAGRLARKCAQYYDPDQRNDPAKSESFNRLAEILETLENMGIPSALLRRESEDIYFWERDEYGRSLKAEKPAERQESQGEAAIHMVLLRDLESFIRAMTQGRYTLAALAGELSLLGPTPPWNDVDAALKMLASSVVQPGANPDHINQTDIVRNYYQMLIDHASVFRKGLYCAALLGGRRDSRNGEPRLALGLGELRSKLSLVGDLAAKSEALDGLLTEMETRESPSAPEPSPLVAGYLHTVLLLPAQEVPLWLPALRTLIEEVDRVFQPGNQPHPS